MDGDRRIPCGGSLGCLPDLLLSGFGFVFGSRSSSFAPARVCVAYHPHRFDIYISM